MARAQGPCACLPAQGALETGPWRTRQIHLKGGLPAGAVEDQVGGGGGLVIDHLRPRQQAQPGRLHPHRRPARLLAAHVCSQVHLVPGCRAEDKARAARVADRSAKGSLQQGVLSGRGLPGRTSHLHAGTPSTCQSEVVMPLPAVGR